MNGKSFKDDRTKLIVRKIGFFFLFIGLTGWFIPDIIKYHGIELPNSRPRGLSIDGEGNIFCGSATYERIQMYDKNGKFVRAFDADVGKGSGVHFTFKVKDSQLHIHVYDTWNKPERIDRKIAYSLDGSLLQATDIPSTDYEGYKVNNNVHDALGNSYVFKGFLFPRVVKKNDDGNDIIIGTPIYLWPFQSPLPAFAFFFIPILVLAGTKKYNRAANLSGR